MSKRIAEPTIVQLWDDYFIEYVPPMNWTLKRLLIRKRRETKEEYTSEDVIGYYSDPGSCARSLLRQEIAMQGKHATVVDFIATINRVEEEISASIEKLADELRESR
jgi:hypothetical protein